MIKKIKNKSSIIRIIISDFDDKGIKEIKVLYNKQGGVDTFEIGTKFDNGELIFTKCEPKRREKEDDFKCDISEDGKSITISKTVFKKETRRYEISEYKVPDRFEAKEKNKIVNLQVEDLLHEETDKRRVVSHTQRKLLDSDLVERYKQIAQGDDEVISKDISSKDIYKIKRFLSYRSNMLIYFQFINDFLTKGIKIKDKNGKEEKVEEIWKLVNKEKGIEDEMLIDEVTKNISSYLIKSIENHNNRIKNLKDKGKDVKDEEFNAFDTEILKRDIEKIIYLFANFRHKLMHYDYKFFDNIFNNLNSDFDNKTLSDLLNLNLFDELSKIKNLKEENKNNYLSNEDKIEIFGKGKKATEVYKTYNMICNRKNGFNKFINSIFVKDGVEDEDFKNKINSEFLISIQNLENKVEEIKNKITELDKEIVKIEIQDEKLKLKREKKTLERTVAFIDSLIKDKQNIIKIMSYEKNGKEIFQPYYWDIQQYEKYKKIYNRRKNRIEKLSNIIQQGKNKDNKKYISDLNKELLNFKNEMEKITKVNSKSRLEYKMKIAFGFLASQYSKSNDENKKCIDIKAFMDDKKFLLENTESLILNKEKYLEINKEKNIDFNIVDIQSLLEDKNDFLTSENTNLLAKFYVLFYILLPYEIKGDFLGFVKKHYYDIKNIDFIEFDEKKTEEEKDSFFQTLRLFEKNSKKFEIVSYNISNFEELKNDFDRIYEKFGLNISVLKSIEQQVEGENKVFGKNIILPIMKYYQHIFKLLNDIEIHALFYYGDYIAPNFGQNIQLNLEETLDNIKGKGHLNFTNLMLCTTKKLHIKKLNDKLKKICDSNLSEVEKNEFVKKLRYLYLIRNDIAHLDYNNLFLNSICGDLLEVIEENKKVKLTLEESKYSISERIEFILDEIRKDINFKDILGMDFINDFYQRKEQFIFNQNQVNVVGILDSKKKLKDIKEKELLEKYQIKKDSIEHNLDSLLKRYFQLINIDEKTKFKKNREMIFLENIEIILPMNDDNKNKNKEERTKSIKELNDIEIISYKENILKKIECDASNLLGIYKKYMVKKLKIELIKLFTKGEKRYLKLELCNVNDYNKFEDKSKLKNEFILEFKEECNGTWDEITNPIYIPNSQENIKVDKIKDNHYSIDITTSTNNKLNATYKDGIFSMESQGKILERNILHGAVKIKNSEGKEEEKYQGIYYQNLKIKY